LEIGRGGGGGGRGVRYMFVRLMATLQACLKVILKGLSQETDLGYKKNSCKEIGHNRGEMMGRLPDLNPGLQVYSLVLLPMSLYYGYRDEVYNRLLHDTLFL
jgi:hypothetical protein